MNILKNEAQVLGQKLSTTNDKARLASYAGAAYAYMELNRKDLTGISKSEVKMKASDLYYDLTEIAVIEKDLLIDTTTKFIEFLNRPLSTSNMIMCFDDLAGINNIFGKATVEAINENIDCFRDVRNAYKEAIKA